MTHEIHVIGIGDDGAQGLSPELRSLVEKATVLVGGERHLGFFPDISCRKVPVKGSTTQVLEHLAKEGEGERIVVLASGDPLFYGIAKLVIARFGKDHVVVHPHVSSMQLAFAAVRESWEDAILVSCHAKPVENLLEAARDARKLGVFTDEENTPSHLASALLGAGLGGFRAYVCENLGGKDERVSSARLSELVGKSYAPLNVLILVREEDASVPTPQGYPLGIPEEYFEQKRPRRGLITKWEIRVISLARLEIVRDTVAWDIGAGSGSVAVECARLAPEGQVFAVEKDADDASIVARNAERFHLPNLKVIHGKAPDALRDLPDPDAVFVGGSGGELAALVTEAIRRLKPGGRFVANMTTLENLQEVLKVLRSLGQKPQVSQVNLARSKPILELTGFEAQNPVSVVYLRKVEAK